MTCSLWRAAILLAALCGSSWAASSNSLMDISADGKLLACSNRDNGSVSIVDLATQKTVGRSPSANTRKG